MTDEEIWSPEVKVFGWPDEGKGPYRLALHFAVVEGRLECVGLEVGHRSEARMEFGPDSFALKPITSTLLRDIRLGELVERYIQDPNFEWRLEHDAAATEYLPEFEEIMTRASQVLETLVSAKQKKPRGRPALPPEHYVDVARIYTEAYQRGLKPTKAVQEELSVSKSTAAKWVSRCRELGLLPLTRRGKPSA